MNRQAWHNNRETHLTYQRSFLTRLNYVHQKPVKHGLVPATNQYRWRSAAWFERTTSPAQVKSIYCLKGDRVRMPDDLVPEL